MNFELARHLIEFVKIKTGLEVKANLNGFSIIGPDGEDYSFYSAEAIPKIEGFIAGFEMGRAPRSEDVPVYTSILPLREIHNFESRDGKHWEPVPPEYKELDAVSSLVDRWRK